MKTIHKFPLSALKNQKIKINKDAEILRVESQNNVPTLWALVDDSKPLVNIKIRLYYTGEEIKTFGQREYLGTCLLHEGELVLHVFKIN